MIKLSVNINKVATIRNARGGNLPDVLKFALDCERFGADGITVHPRPDERHIRNQDVKDLKGNIATELNVEGYPSADFLKLVKSVKPHQVTLVPDPPEALTSNSGWDTIACLPFLKDIVSDLHQHSIRVSVFIGTDLKHVEYAALTGTDRVELYTEPYAAMFNVNKEKAVKPFLEAALLAQQAGLKVNAGHDLSLENLYFLVKSIPWIQEVSIGHALISEALYLGIEKTIIAYKQILKSIK